MFKKVKFLLIYFIVAIIFCFPIVIKLNKICLPSAIVAPSVITDYPEYSDHSQLARNNLVTKHSLVTLENPGLDIAVTYDYFYIFFKIFGLSRNIIFNLFLLTVITTSGFATYLLTFWLSKNTYVSFLAGFLYMSSNFVFNEYYWGHVNLVQIQYLPLILYFVEKNLVEKGVKNVIFLALSIFLQILSSSQYSLYLSVILILYVFSKLVFAHFYKLKGDYHLKHVIIAIVLALIISLLYLNFRFQFRYDLRSANDNLTSYFKITNFTELLDISKNTYLGIQTFILFIFGIIYIFYKKNKSKLIVYFPYLLIILICPILMLGPYSNKSLYFYFYRYYPLFNYFRVPVRFFPFLYLSTIICAISPFIFLKNKLSLNVFKILYSLIILLTFILTYFSIYFQYNFYC